MLREYQKDLYIKIRTSSKNNKGVCAVAPCRSGKTFIIKEIVDGACKKGSKVLIEQTHDLPFSKH